jgi:isocitrate dehydrogenase kinase/phosphatase
MESTLQDCFDQVNWEMFWAASENNIDLYADSVSEFINPLEMLYPLLQPTLTRKCG